MSNIDPDVTAFGIAIVITVIIVAFALGHLVTEMFFHLIDKLHNTRKMK